MATLTASGRLAGSSTALRRALHPSTCRKSAAARRWSSRRSRGWRHAPTRAATTTGLPCPSRGDQRTGGRLEAHGVVVGRRIPSRWGRIGVPAVRIRASVSGPGDDAPSGASSGTAGALAEGPPDARPNPASVGSVLSERTWSCCGKRPSLRLSVRNSVRGPLLRHQIFQS